MKNEHNNLKVRNQPDPTRFPRRVARALALLATLGCLGQAGSRAAAAPTISSFSKPLAGSSQIIFHGSGGPFQIQMRQTLDANAPWSDVPGATVTELQPGVYLGMIPEVLADVAFYRVMSAGETIVELKGWTLETAVSAPANGTYFRAGEAPVITVKILDTMSQGITRDSFSGLNLYMAGPMDPQKTVSAVKLLNATTDRTKSVHHYISLKASTDVVVNGNTLTYNLKPITDEAPGTYTIGVRATLASDGIQTVIKYADIQIGTATPEQPVVTRDKCASCHEGTISGKMYMHHIDVGRSPTGSWDLDYEPVTSCILCHNNDGYAAYNDASVPGGKVPDAIVLRAHGVHMGEGLQRDFNTNSVTGNFRDYVPVVFPADVRNCTACHADDRWKTTPTRAACGSCHDTVWFGAPADKPADMVAHVGGKQANDNTCSLCHGADPSPDESFISISAAHLVAPPAFKQSVNVSMSAPANGQYFVAGEAPQVMIKVIDLATGLAINPTNIVEPLISTNVQPNEWKRANLYVSGPRALTVPVLTAAATNTTVSTAGNELRYRLDPAKDNPSVTRSVDTITYQLGTISNLTAGTYTVYAEFGPATAPNPSGMIHFQVGTTNVEPSIAASCISCHGDTRIHATSRALTMQPDACKSCHDYAHQMTGKTSWSTSQYGFGVSPISRRVHGIHYGNYLDKPTQNTSGIAEIIFPQDVRNCTKCHGDANSITWTEKPSRLACLACHDEDAAQAHGTLMTYDPTPADPWSGDEMETCEVCHGSDADFSPAKVHSISNPYVPPYPRALREP